MSKLKAYMGYSEITGSREAAVLVFAHTVKEARKLAFDVLRGWGVTDEWIDVRASWLKTRNFLFEQANQELLKAETPHVIDDPICCKGCDLWGMELKDGLCENCSEGKTEGDVE